MEISQNVRQKVEKGRFAEKEPLFKGILEHTGKKIHMAYKTKIITEGQFAKMLSESAVDEKNRMHELKVRYGRCTGLFVYSFLTFRTKSFY